MTLTKEQFSGLFTKALTEAQANAEKQIESPLSSNWAIKLYGVGSPGDELSVEAGVEKLYVAEDRFLKVIDVGVWGAGDCLTVFFVRASDHEHVSLKDTWGGAVTGPFKVIEPLTVKQL